MKRIVNKACYVFFILAFLLTILDSSAYAFTLYLPGVLPGESQYIQTIGSTVIIKGITNQDNKLAINDKEVNIQKDGSFQEDVIIPLGETEITVIVEDPKGKIKTYKKTIKAKEDHFFLVALADGTLNFSTGSEGFRWERDSKHFEQGIRLDGKLSYYLVGKIKGKFLIKSSLDTDKSTQEKLFTNIDPDEYYPIYGDNSTVCYDVNSQGMLYVLVQWDKSGITLGNYQTQIGNEDSKLTTYNRTLYGGKAHFETMQRTLYGEPIGCATLFAAEANQHAGHSELLGTGGSLYYLRHRNITEGSEQIAVEVRDKRTGMKLYSIPQSQNVDYEIKYNEGRIMFKKPVLSVAQSDTIAASSILDGNPVYIVANYEYNNQEAFPIGVEDLDHRTGGVRLSQHIGDNIRIGATYVQEEKDNRNHKLYGGDATIKIGNFTKINAEFAESTAGSISSYISYNGGYDYTEVEEIGDRTEGKAFRAELNTCIGEYFGLGHEAYNVSAYWQYIGEEFSPVDSLFEAGTEKCGISGSHKVTENDKIRFLYERSELDKGCTNQSAENQLTAKRVENYLAQWDHVWRQFTFTTEYLFRRKKEPLSSANPDEDHKSIVGERIRYDLSKDTSVFLSQQIAIGESNDSITSTGFSTKLFEDTTLHARASYGMPDNDSSIVAGVEKTIDENTSVYINYALADSLIDGKSSTTSFGSNAKIGKTGKLRTERQFITRDDRESYASNLIGFENQLSPELWYDVTYQRRDEELDHTLMGSTPDDTISANISCVIPDFISTFSKFEYRTDSNDMWQYLFDNQAEVKLNSDIFVFGELETSEAFEEDHKDATSRIHKKQVGLAYRPVKFDWFNLLFKYIRFIDERPEDVNNADGGFLEIKSTSNVLAGECAIDLPFNFQFVEKISYKDQDILAYDPTGNVKTPEDLEAFLMIHRLNYHLTKQIDAAFEFRVLDQEGSDVDLCESGFLIEATYQFRKGLAIGAGFNFTSFGDDLLEMDDDNAGGFFFRLQGKY
ncbi:MAG: hypothetical protein JSV93_00220 [Candidatus Omnitrophota bacterium]|nr:MAG: hypothetical protein JSV93_00220 [Candidatus Omnitrophota bacterium]